MKPTSHWSQTSPRGTAKERFARLRRQQVGFGTRWRVAESATDSAMGSAQTGPHMQAGAGVPAGRAADTVLSSPAEFAHTRHGRSGDNDSLYEFFRNVAAGAHTHDLGDESLYLAEEITELLGALDEPQRRALAVLVLASLISVRQGSTRLPLSRDPSSNLGEIITSLLRAGRLDLDVQAVLCDIAELTANHALNQVLGREDDYCPLIVADGCVYQHRMRWCENQLATRLRVRLDRDRNRDWDRDRGPASSAAASVAAAARIATSGRATRAQNAPSATAIAGAVAQVLARPAVAGGQPIALSPEQQRAVHTAVSRRFAVISGGPGTGKTAIVVSILRVLRRLGEPTESIALAAPTGKAANRMWASIRRGLQAVGAPDAVDAELLAAGVEPQTLHRLLGYMPGADRFRHHDNNPLRASTVIVDEASMIDLVLMERLLRSVSPEARLILLGDADQLPSVDAGAILRDLVLASEQGRSFAVRLTRSYRMDPSNPAGRAILSAAGAINTGTTEPLFDSAGASADDSAGDFPGRITVRQSPAELAWAGVELLDTNAVLARMHRFVDHWYDTRIASHPDISRLATKAYRYRDGHWADGDASDLAALFAVYERSRLLTVTRRQDTGVEAVNRRLHRRVLASASVDYTPDFYPGEPVMMRRNDYERGLFNGDQGMVVRVTEDGVRHHFRVVFPRGETYAVFPLDALRLHIEHAFAMTVHKSQGSELDEVALLLPAEAIPLLTREMLYTGMTRARHAAVLVGTADLVCVAAARPGRRFSGLAAKLAL